MIICRFIDTGPLSSYGEKSVTRDLGKIWHGPWADRVAQSVRRLGFGSMPQFLGTMPARPWAEVARCLGDHIAPIQIVSVLYAEAKPLGKIRDAAKDALCREIVEELPDGWGVSENADWKAALALGTWTSNIMVTGQCPELEPILDRIVDRIRDNPPPAGWRPSGPDDPLITSIFDAEWPEGSVTSE